MFQYCVLWFVTLVSRVTIPIYPPEPPRGARVLSREGAERPLSARLEPFSWASLLTFHRYLPRPKRIASVLNGAPESFFVHFQKDDRIALDVYAD